MTIQLTVRMIQIAHHSFQAVRACFSEVAMLADMVREVIEELGVHKFVIQFINIMLYNFWFNLSVLLINTVQLSRRQMMVPSGVTLPFLLFVLS